MALTSGEFNPTSLVAYISETWTPKVLEEFFDSAVAANFFLDLSQFATGGSDVLHVPDAYTNAFTIQTAADPFDAAEITTGSATSVDVTLTIDTHKYIATIIGDRDLVQIDSAYNFSEIYNRKAMGTLMEDLDGALYALHSSVTTNTVGDTASVITDSELRQAVEKLRQLNLPMSELAWHINPYAYWNQVLAVQKFYDASQFGGGAATATGNFGSAGLDGADRGTLYGIRVLESSNVVNTLLATKNLLAHKDAFAFATQLPGGGRVRAQADYLLDRLGTLAVWDAHYGVVASRESSAVVINGSNAFVAS